MHRNTGDKGHLMLLCYCLQALSLKLFVSFLLTSYAEDKVIFSKVKLSLN